MCECVGVRVCACAVSSNQIRYGPDERSLRIIVTYYTIPYGLRSVHGSRDIELITKVNRTCNAYRTAFGLRIGNAL